MTTTARFRLIDHDWTAEFAAAAKLKTDEVLITSPFIKESAALRLTKGKKPVRVLTRFSLRDFAERVSDTSALRSLIEAGAEVRGIKNLHAKMYVFGKLRAIVTSANLTDAALTRNHELGFVSDDGTIIAECREYFERLWSKAAKHQLTLPMLNAWDAEIDAVNKGRKSAPSGGYKDYGANLGFLPDAPPSTSVPSITTQAFVKFFGEGHKRVSPTMRIIDEVRDSGSHFALSFPAKKRPRQEKTGDVVFIGRMVAPGDLRFYGRAIAIAHDDQLDNASEADKKKRTFRARWSTFLRVRDPEFINGTLADGISRNELMDKFGPETFLSTSENQRLKNGKNTRPRIALRSKAHMPLTQVAADWLNAKFYEAVAKHGKILQRELDTIDQSEVPGL